MQTFRGKTSCNFPKNVYESNLCIDEVFTLISKKVSSHYTTPITYTLFITRRQSQHWKCGRTKRNATMATVHK